MGWLGRLFGGPKRQTGRAEMDSALKRLVVPALREAGFKGAMPHLRRLSGGHYDLLSFQFSKWGGAFAVEAARCRRDGVETPLGHVPGDRAKAWDMPRRHRVGAGRAGGDHWFKFEHDDPDAVAQRLLAELGKPALWEIAETLPLDWPEGEAEAGARAGDADDADGG